MNADLLAKNDRADLVSCSSLDPGTAFKMCDGWSSFVYCHTAGHCMSQKTTHSYLKLSGLRFDSNTISDVCHGKHTRNTSRILTSVKIPVLPDKHEACSDLAHI